MKLLGIVTVEFDSTDPLRLLHPAFIKYLRKMVKLWHSVWEIY